MDAEVFVPLLFFGFLGAVILVPIWLRERTSQSAHQLLSQALEKGQPLDPAILRQLTEGKVRSRTGRAGRWAAALCCWRCRSASWQRTSLVAISRAAAC